MPSCHDAATMSFVTSSTHAAGCCAGSAARPAAAHRLPAPARGAREVRRPGARARARHAPGRHRWTTWRGIHKIKHVVVVMQENRSFDSYFGTFPGADGIPMKDGRSVACDPPRRRLLPAPVRRSRGRQRRRAARPSATTRRLRPRPDGRLPRQGVRAHKHCHDPNNPVVQQRPGVDVLGLPHAAATSRTTGRYAHRYVLQDHMFEPIALLEPARAPVAGLGVVGARAPAGPPRRARTVPSASAAARQTAGRATAAARRGSRSTRGPT